MKAILWFFKYGWVKPAAVPMAEWRGGYMVVPRRGIVFNEGSGPVNFALYWWPHVFCYVAVRLFGTWRRLSFDWS